MVGLLRIMNPYIYPFDDILARVLGALMKQNDIIRKECNVKNDYLFITKNGGRIATSPTNNNITKRLSKHSKDYSLKNINPHALRRGICEEFTQEGGEYSSNL